MGLILFGCAGQGSRPPAAEPKAERAGHSVEPAGGLPIQVPSPAVYREAEAVVAWGQVEVPRDARFSATKSLAAAAARTALRAFLRVQVSTLMSDRSDRSGPRAVERWTEAVTAGELPGSGPPDVGWRYGDETLTMVARVRVPVTSLRTVIAAEVGADFADRLLSVLGDESSSESPAKDRAPDDPAAPAWVSAGDRETDRGFRFVCQGEGRTPEDAGTTARAFCEDKICKLCGVEVESVVLSRETLTGVELSREIVERCRRVRTEPARIVRQSLDCPETGPCRAWIEVDYPRDQRDRECKRVADEKFDDPARCEALIDRFAEIVGYSAASFRARVDALEGAATACSNIDVRPTPLLNALDGRLKRGMQTFKDEQGRAPRYLSRYWLATHPPTWDAYADATTFVKKIEVLLGYLRSKPPVLDVIESSLRPPEVLDTEPGFAELIALLDKTPVDHGYGATGVHFFALEQVRSYHRRRMFSQPLGPLWATITRRYPAEQVSEWNRVVGLTWLASADAAVEPSEAPSGADKAVITDDEWRYLTASPRWGARAAQMLLAVEDHGSPRTRIERFRAALARATEGVEGPKALARATERVLPASSFRLDLEPLVPDDARPLLYTYEALTQAYRRIDERLSAAERTRWLARLTEALATIPEDPKEARRHCGRLADNLEFLESRRVRVEAVNAAVCPCLTEHLADRGLSLVGKSDLYQRALDLELPCVMVAPSNGTDS